jgi:hypothetical protein
MNQTPFLADFPALALGEICFEKESAVITCRGRIWLFILE